MEADGFDECIWRDRREVCSARPDAGRARGRHSGPAPGAAGLPTWIVAGLGTARRWIARLQLGPIAVAGCPPDPVDRRPDWPG